MLRELLALLPDVLLRCPSGTAAVCAGLGAALWLIGGRFSRSILALAAVALGTFIGMRLPVWRGWQIDGMGVAVGGAILLGTAAFLFHRTCIGLLLGTGLVLWAGTGVWIFLAGQTYWDLHSVRWQGDLAQLLQQAWRTLPPSMTRVFPMACFAGLGCGITIAVFLPKLARVMTHSLIGVTLMAIMGAIFIGKAHPRWLQAIPRTQGMQGFALIGLVLVGVIIQWRMTPSLPKRIAPHGKPNPHHGAQRLPDRGLGSNAVRHA
jgi:hypothetical protein